MPDTVAEFKLTPTTPRTLRRRAKYFDINASSEVLNLVAEEYALTTWEKIDLVYRTLCAILYNSVPTSGHPGGSISSGRIAEALLFETMVYDFSQPDRPDNDMISYAAGHKAMGLYALWALRNELVRVGNAKLLADETRQLRLEDLLGFRRNPTNDTPLFKTYRAKALDGHPTCMTPFIKHATGASGVGVPTAFGVAAAALDIYRDDPPRMHVIEGEGGMTPGRVHEALAAAATNNISNIILHVDFNQASIDSNHVCADEDGPGEYVQWNPGELTFFHHWNTINVEDGKDFRQVLAAQRAAMSLDNGQPTAVIYRTIKGWKYGIEGRTSHGAGHKFASDGYYAALKEFEDTFETTFPRFAGDVTPVRIEQFFYDSLMVVREVCESNREMADMVAEHLSMAQTSLNSRKRRRHAKAPDINVIFDTAKVQPGDPPERLQFKPGDSITLRAALGDTLGELNRRTGGAFMATAADLSGSTSIAAVGKGFADGFYNAKTNPDSRLIALGGICEDNMGGFMAGMSSFGEHIGVSSSYGAFIAALEHIAARLHGIGQQAREEATGEPYNTWIMVNAHAGAKTGEDGPTHADPQPLQLLQECFPGKVLITLTPWDAREMWPLVVAALRQRPAVLAPFVTRPSDTLVDWDAMKLPSIMETCNGVYAMRRADRSAKQYNGTIVLQGNGVASIFVNEVLPRIDQAGYNMNVYYISSAEMFNLLEDDLREQIFPSADTFTSMGITDFTLPTMYRWVRSPEGIKATLHSFRHGHFLGSGSAAKVLEEAGIHGDGQWSAIKEFAEGFEKKR
ncbi:MAG: transketolase [Candidatus Zixiibacteriota bacterium]